MSKQLNENASKSSPKGNSLVRLLSADLRVNQLINSNSYITSSFLPHANGILSYALMIQKEIHANSLNSKLWSVSNKILESKNIMIKSEILKTDRFKDAVEFLKKQSESSSSNDFFISHFASITENYLTHLPQLIRNEFSFLIAFSKFIFTNFQVYLLFKRLLNESSLNSYLIHDYLRQNNFIDFLFDNLNDDSINLLIICARTVSFRNPNLINHLLNFDLNDALDQTLINRKWEIIAEYVKTTIMNYEDENKFNINSLSDFLSIINQAFNHVQPLNYTKYMQSQVSALQFLSAMFSNSSLKAENAICNIKNLLITLKDIIINFPDHTIAVNEVFMLAENLLLLPSTRQNAIEVFIPFAHKLLMYQKFQNNQSKDDSNRNEESEVHSQDECQIETKSKSLYSFFTQCSHLAQSTFSNDSNCDSSPLKYQNEDDDAFTTVVSNDEEVDNFEEEIKEDEKSNSENIDSILSYCLRGFAASFFNRLMEDEDDDIELEKDLNENDIFSESVEYLVEIYNPLSESGYGYTHELKYSKNGRLNMPYLDMKSKNLFALM